MLRWWRKQFNLKETIIMKKKSSFKVRLFYSYSHKDAVQRSDMERSLTTLRNEGIISEWSDKQIMPGQNISEKIQEKLNEADIVVFLLSNNFINSEECCREWEDAKKLSEKKHVFRIPIILTNCPWWDFIKSDDGSEELLEKKCILIHGEEMSGKTALCKYIFLELANKENPVLFIDLQDVEAKKPNDKIFQEVYQEQYEGDYYLWKDKPNKTIIFDNLSQNKHSIEHIVFAEKYFDRIIVSTSSNKFHSFFKDEDRLTEFDVMRIKYLSHVAQEELIKKRISVPMQQESPMHGTIDVMENHINSVIINNKLLPRYPFYILSILQTYEGFMPTNLTMTSYGHCYYALILANLIKSGIEKTDDKINTCFNFAEHLAFGRYQGKTTKSEFTFSKFINDYNNKYLIEDSLLSRLKNPSYGIISEQGNFKHEYMYFYFLGKFFANNYKDHKDRIGKISETSYIHSNSLILLFIIHHTNESDVIEDILLYTMCAFSNIEPATLNNEETRIFETLVGRIPNNILSEDSTDEERKREREGRDVVEKQKETDYDLDEESDHIDPVNDIYRILKNNEILGQILKNKHGNLEYERLLEIIETIADSGLRLVKLVLLDQNEINAVASRLHKQYPDCNTSKLKYFVELASFLLTMINIEKIVVALNKPELNQLVKRIVEKKSTPAYDLIDYFSKLDSVEIFGNNESNQLADLLKKHDDKFIKRVVSIRTQHYLNTHDIRAPIEQSVCNTLKIPYKPRMKNTRKGQKALSNYIPQ